MTTALPNIGAVLFDLDGTLLDTLPGLVNSVNAALRMHGLPERTTDEIRSFVGNGVHRLIALSAPGGDARADFDSIVSDFRSHYAAHAAEGSLPYPGIAGLLGSLRARGIALGVVTNKDQNHASSLIGRFFPGMFGVVSGGNAGNPPKPSPASSFAALRALGAETSGSVFVGDSEVDAATAAAAGMPALLCSWGFRPRDVLARIGRVVDEPGEILALLQ